jgi:uncharacterized protein (TIGR02145 family)
LTGLPLVGNWTVNPGGTSGTGNSLNITGLTAGITYNFTVTDANGCTSAATSVVINGIPAGPAAPTIGVITQPTCLVSTGSVQLNGLPGTGAWTLTILPGGTTIPGTGATWTVSGIPASSTWTFTVTDAGGCISVESAAAVINTQPVTPPAPVVTVVNNCGNSVLTASGYTGTLLWSTGETTVSITVTSAGVYTVTASDGGCTSISGAGTVTVVDSYIPSQPSAIVGAAGVCVGTSQTYSVTNVAGVTYTWVLPGGWAKTSGGATNSIVVTVGAISGTITVTPSNTCGSGTSRTLAVSYYTVPSQPSTITGNTTPCAGTAQTYSVTNVGGLTYTWAFPAGWVQNSGGTTNSIVVTVGTTTGNVQVTPSNPGCSGTARTLAVTINPYPQGTLTANGPFCGTGIGQLTWTANAGTGPFTIVYNDGFGNRVASNVTSGTPYNVFTTPVTTTTTYTLVAVTGNNGCSRTATFTGRTATISVHPLPQGILTGSTICAGGTGQFTFTATEGTEPFTLMISGQSYTGVISGTAFKAIPNPTVTTVYTLSSIVDSNSCSRTSGLTEPNGTITVNPLTVLTWATPGPWNFCQDDTPPTLPMPTNDPPITGTWSPATISTAAAGISSYTFTPTAGQCAAPDVLSVNVTALLIPAFAPKYTYCQGSNPALPAEPNGLTGTWVPALINTTTIGITPYTFNPTGACSVPDTVDIEIVAPPTASISYSSPSYCKGAGGTFLPTVLPSGGTSFVSSPTGLAIASSTGRINVELSVSGSYTVLYTSTSDVCTVMAMTTVTINATPASPIVGTLTQPTCALAIGSVDLTGLPETGTWTLTRNPGGSTTTGNGTTTKISGLAAGTYNFAVTNSVGCTSVASVNVVIEAQPVTPPPPTIGTITMPTCALATGSVNLSGLPETGIWTLKQNPEGATTTGTGTTTTISGLATGTYTYTLTNAVGCTSVASANVVINTQPVTPQAPNIGIITQPTCAVATGSVVLSGLPAGTWTINPRTIAGTGASTTVSNLEAGTYNFTITNAVGCTSVASANLVIDSQPVTPTAPVVGTTTQPTCAVATGSVNLSGLPGTGTWTLRRNPGGATTPGTGTTTMVSGLATGTYTYTVTNAAICTSVASGNVVINPQPVTPSAPIIGTITQPTCDLATGSVALSGLPGTGTWTLTRNPGGVTTTGTGTATTISGLATGIYTYTVTHAEGCTSVASANVVINTAPPGSAPVGSSVQTFRVGATVANLKATGTAILWYADATGGLPLTSSDILVDRNHYYASQTVDGCESFNRLDVEVILYRFLNKPDWVVNVNEFLYDGEIIAQVLIDDLVNAEPEGILAGFAGNSCRGVKQGGSIGPGGKYGMSLRVYANESSGETLTFKYFDPVLDTVLSISETMPFEINMQVGDAMNPYPMHAKTIPIAIKPLAAGWNWISLNLQNPDMSIGNVLANLDTQTGDYIKNQTVSATFFSGSGWFGDLKTIDPGKLYKVKVARNDTIKYKGYPVNPATMPLTIFKGWNWIGYLPQQMETVSEALASMIPMADDYIKNQTKSATFYDGPGWFGEMNVLEPLDGYMLKAGKPSVLTYPVKSMVTTPTVTTTAVSDITQSTAASGGNITNDGGSSILARGVCWSTGKNPTLPSSNTVNGNESGSYSSNLIGLTSNTTYYVRAYATNSEGTAYGQEVSFKTALGSDDAGTLTDTRDSEVYNWIRIGTQVWMAENLAYLPAVIAPANGSLTLPSYYVYGYEGTNVIDAKLSGNYNSYGVLYNWKAAKTSCPAGWHLPNDTEWTTLTDFLTNNYYGFDGSGSDIGKSMASTSGWTLSPTAGTVGNDQGINNSSGFSALPGGYRNLSGAFSSLGTHAYFWSVSNSGTLNAFTRYLIYTSSGVIHNNHDISYGFSVRCMRD